jgi:hypothetical protein
LNNSSLSGLELLRYAVFALWNDRSKSGVQGTGTSGGTNRWARPLNFRRPLRPQQTEYGILSKYGIIEGFHTENLALKKATLKPQLKDSTLVHHASLSLIAYSAEKCSTVFCIEKIIKSEVHLLPAKELAAESTMNFSCRLFLAYSVLMVSIKNAEPAVGDAYTMISRHQTDCELESLSVGTALADKYNSFIEGTEREERLKNDYLMQRLGFLTQPGSAGHTNISNSSYWALENQWIYMLGDSTQRQVWTTLAAPVSPTSEAATEKCQSQGPHRHKQTLGVIHDNLLSQQVSNIIP